MAKKPKDLMFATRDPLPDETSHIKALLSTFRDGSGNQKEKDGTTRASWREIERCVAEVVAGPASEDKHIFDVIAPDTEDPSVCYGLSIKSKQLSKKTFHSLKDNGRVYMEVANSPAKFWDAIGGEFKHTEQDFREMKHAEKIGNCVLAAVEAWHEAGKAEYEDRGDSSTLDLQNSRYLCVSYSEDAPDSRQYQIHAFDLKFPKVAKWEYTSPKCLRGYDPSEPDKALFDWYGTSGGQLKYYPRAKDAVFKSEPFTLLKPPGGKTLTEKAEAYFPDEFENMKKR